MKNTVDESRLKPTFNLAPNVSEGKRGVPLTHVRGWRHESRGTGFSLCALVAISILLAGCGRAPSVDLLGSFFPVWMFCLTIAVIAAFAIRWILVRLRLESEVGPLALFYPSVVILLTSLLWLVFFK